MQKDKAGIFTGPLSFVLTGLVEERHRMGFRFKEEERLLHELDRMSIGFDCTGGLTQELVTKFIERKPNWHQRGPFSVLERILPAKSNGGENKNA